VGSYPAVSPLPAGLSRGERAVCSLWHSPRGHPHRALPGTLPFGARTFLPRARPLTEPTGARLDLSASGDVEEAAAHLFAHLRSLDATGAATIAVAQIPERGLGAAINDRLRRAAAPRPT